MANNGGKVSVYVKRKEKDKGMVFEAKRPVSKARVEGFESGSAGVDEPWSAPPKACPGRRGLRRAFRARRSDDLGGALATNLSFGKQLLVSARFSVTWPVSFCRRGSIGGSRSIRLRAAGRSSGLVENDCAAPWVPRKANEDVADRAPAA